MTDELVYGRTSKLRVLEFRDDDAWKKYRLDNGFGASESAAFFPAGKWRKYRSAADVVAAKLGDVPEESRRSLKIRELMESGIAANYCHWRSVDEKKYPELHAPERRAIFFAAEAPFVLSTPDAWTLDRIVEFKTAGDVDDWDEKGVPITYQIQVQQQMYCTGLRSADLAVLFMAREPEFRIYHYEADDEFHGILVARLRTAWEIVQARRRGESVPLPDAGPDDSALLAKLCPPVPEKVVQMAPADFELAERWKSRKAEFASYRKITDGFEELVKADQNALLTRMDGASTATFQNSGLRLVSKLRERKAADGKVSQWLELKEDKE